MAHHAFVTEGSAEEVIRRARSYASETLGMAAGSSDFLTYTFGHLSVKDARRVIDVATQSAAGEHKVIVLYATRLFHEAQNALLKIFEEPPAGVVIILGVPTTGIVLSTLRSRLMPFPNEKGSEADSKTIQDFFALSSTEREKYVAKLIERTKSDNEDTKGSARAEVLEVVGGLMQAAHARLQNAENEKDRAELLSLLEDLSAFIPILHERSAPLKLIFEHLLLTLPSSLAKARV